MQTAFKRLLSLVGLQIFAAVAHAQATWTQVLSLGLPPQRAWHRLSFDSLRGRVVMFGGVAAFTGTYLGDTWEWNGSLWSQAGGAGPQARSGHSMAYDSQRARTVLFGGSGASGLLGDTWEWDGSTWMLASAAAPSPREWHAMAYDGLRGRTVLFGGRDTAPAIGDTWEWDGNSWSQVATVGPTARWQAAMAYDVVRGKTVLFGGFLQGGTRLGDTWEWNGGAWVQTALLTTPPARGNAAMTCDFVRGRIVLVGGEGQSSILGDTWEWDGGPSWIQQTATPAPSARYGSAITYDSVHQKSLFFGGASNSSTYYNDTWLWGGAFVPNTPATAVTFGTACGNPPLTLSPVVSARPIINATAQASLSSIPSSIAFVALGWSRTTAGPFPLPFSLAGYGMPTCYMLQSTEAAAQPVTFVGPGVATFSLHLPYWSGLVGLHVYLQGWAAAPGANLGNTIVSNGIDWTIGNS